MLLARARERHSVRTWLGRLIVSAGWQSPRSCSWRSRSSRSSQRRQRERRGQHGDADDRDDRLHPHPDRRAGHGLGHRERAREPTAGGDTRLAPLRPDRRHVLGNRRVRVAGHALSRRGRAGDIHAVHADRPGYRSLARDVQRRRQQRTGDGSLRRPRRARRGASRPVPSTSSPPPPPPPAVAPTPSCQGQTATIVPAAGQTLVTGTQGRDVIVGRDSAETLDGRGGDDRIRTRGGIPDRIDCGPLA